MADHTLSIDNGINIAAETAYSQQTDLSARVRRLNPRWNEPAPDSVYDVRPPIMCSYAFTCLHDDIR